MSDCFFLPQSTGPYGPRSRLVRGKDTYTVLLLIDHRDVVNRFRSAGRLLSSITTFSTVTYLAEKTSRKKKKKKFVAKDTDDNHLWEPLDGQPLGALSVPVATFAHLKHKNTHQHL